MVDVPALVVCLLVPVVGGMIGGFATAKEIKGWYATLTKPWWNPPNWLFGPVWTCLYAAMGYASYLVYEQGGFAKQATPLAIYITQLALNFLWTPLFFIMHRFDLATYDMLAMWGLIVATIATFYPVIGAWALGLLIPYLVWVSYASALTIWLWRNNPTKAGASLPVTAATDGNPINQQLL